MFTFFSPLDQFDLYSIKFFHIYLSVKYSSTFYYFNLSITSGLLPFFLICLFIIYFKQILTKVSSLIPRPVQRLWEISLTFVMDIVKSQATKKALKYFPYIYCIFLFILFSNILGLLPFGIAMTSHLITLLWLSLSITLGIFFLGIILNNLTFFKIFIPECPLVLLPFIIVIEIFSYIIRSFSLAIRLAANILAGHSLVFIIMSFIIMMGYCSIFGFTLASLGFIFIMILETFVAFLQAYVFTILICIYLRDALYVGH